MTPKQEADLRAALTRITRHIEDAGDYLGALSTGAVHLRRAIETLTQLHNESIKRENAARRERMKAKRCPKSVGNSSKSSS
jgi:hypothetical protein